MLPIQALLSEWAAVLYCDEIVGGDGRFFVRHLFPPPIVRMALHSGLSLDRVDSAVSVDATEDRGQSYE